MCFNRSRVVKRSESEKNTPEFERWWKINKSRVVKPSKYERNAPELERWWKERFEELEADSKIPREQRSELVAPIFPSKLYRHVARILNLDPTLKPRKLQTRRRTFREEFLTQQDSHSQESEDLHPKGRGRRKTIQELLDDDDEDEVDLETLVKPPSPREPFKKPLPPVSPYHTFVMKKGKDAVSWNSRYIPTVELEECEKSLHQRATEKTHAICKEFIEWFHSLGGTESKLTEQSMMQLFEIGHVDDAARALQVKLRELPTVTQEVADAVHLPKRAVRATLHRQVARDQRAANRPEIESAFGTRLPKELQVKKPATDPKEWVECGMVPEDLATMKHVWEGITAIRATRAFCTWLIDHPEIEPPPYLVECGLLEGDYGVSKGQPRMSIDPRSIMPEEEGSEEDKSEEDVDETEGESESDHGVDKPAVADDAAVADDSDDAKDVKDARNSLDSKGARGSKDATDAGDSKEVVATLDTNSADTE